MISYFFPPNTSVGGLRAYSFYQYLPEQDIDVIVLTSGTKKQVKECYQTKEEYPKVFYSKETKLRELGYKIRILPLLELFRLDKLLFFPDIYFKWIKRAIRKGNEVVKKEQPDLILVTGPPFSSFKVAFRLSVQSNIPLILDYRDPWLGNPYTHHPSKAIMRRIRKWEKKFTDQSDLLITVGPEYKEFISNKLNLDENSIIVVHNGFFPDSLQQNKIKKSEEIFTISFFGSFYTLQKPIFEEFVEGFRLMIERENLKQAEIKFQYAGGVSRSVINKIITKRSISPYFKDLGFLTLEQLNTEIQKSNVMFITIPKGTEYMLQQKVYDYLNGNSHILLIGEKSAMSRLCLETDQQFTETRLTREEISETLIDLYNKWKNKELKYGCNLEKLENYNRKNLANKLAKIIKTTFNKSDI